MKQLTCLFALLTLAQNGSAAVPCQNQDFIEMPSPVIIQTQGRSYSPRCLKVKAGTQITIQASGHHPLAAMDEFNSVANPFANTQGGFETDQTRTLSAPGVYGYFCTVHGDASGNGMAGMILVE